MPSGKEEGKKGGQGATLAEGGGGEESGEARVQLLAGGGRKGRGARRGKEAENCLRGKKKKAKGWRVRAVRRRRRGPVQNLEQLRNGQAGSEKRRVTKDDQK